MPNTPTSSRIISRRTFAVVSSILFLVLVGMLAAYFLLNRGVVVVEPHVYTIPGVPYVGLHSHVGENALMTDDVDAATFALLEYWGLGDYDMATVVERVDSTGPDSEFFSRFRITEVFDSFDGHAAYQERISLERLPIYVNAEVRTPLLTLLPITTDQPSEVRYRPATLLIGIDEKREVLTFHSYWFGSQYELSFDEFEARQEQMPESERNRYIVFQPEEFLTVQKRLQETSPEPYQARPEVVDAIQGAMELHALATGALLEGDTIRERQYYSQLFEHEEFDVLPSFFKVYALTEAADLAVREGDITIAEQYLEVAMVLNEGFDQPIGDWPGYEIRNNGSDVIDNISAPYRILGDVRRLQGEDEEARGLYQQALAIMPANSLAKAGLAALGE